jgi:hypothetical protein
VRHSVRIPHWTAIPCETRNEPTRWIEGIAALSELQIRDILDFLDALTDPPAVNLMDVVPLRVPSGLSVN